MNSWIYYVFKNVFFNTKAPFIKQTVSKNDLILNYLDES